MRPTCNSSVQLFKYGIVIFILIITSCFLISFGLSTMVNTIFKDLIILTISAVLFIMFVIK